MDRGEIEMKTKWPQMWDGSGKERLAMACGACGSRRRTVRPSAATKVTKNPPPEGMILLEYLGVTAKSVWLGKATKQRYIFGSDVEHRRKFVRASDAPGFLAIVGQFREIQLVKKDEAVEGAKPVLAAVMEG